jgi:small subunit ribosomal protein S16
MLSIRFKKEGKKHQQILRLVLIDSKKAINSGIANDILGWMNPKTKEAVINKEKVLDWIHKGAQPTDSVFNLLVRYNIIKGKKIPKHKTAKKSEKDKK